MLVAIAFGFSGCAYDVPGAYTNEQPYAVQQEDTWSEYACGAFSMAYYLAEQGYIPGNQVSSQAKKLYKKVIFPKTSELYPYSEPIKIRDVMAKYSSKSELRMFKVDAAIVKDARDPDSTTNYENPVKAKVLLSELAAFLDYNESDIVTITAKDFASALGKNEYVIEIVDADETVTLCYDDFYRRNSLHYVLTYWKDNVLYTLDPARGREAPRSDFSDGTLEKWNFCDGGIFLTPKNQ